MELRRPAVGYLQYSSLALAKFFKSDGLEKNVLPAFMLDVKGILD
jgi:hypothetical protein